MLVEVVIERRWLRSRPPSLKVMPHEFERRLLAAAASGEILPASGAQASLRSAFGWDALCSLWLCEKNSTAGVIRSLDFVQGHPCGVWRMGDERGAKRSASGLGRTSTSVSCGITLSDGD